MEVRRIIKFGSSSFVVSLPKNWVNKNKLSKGDLLYFNENGNNELVVSPRDADKTKKSKKISIDVTNKPLETIRREIMSAYIHNHDIIRITGELAPIRQDIDNMMHSLLALEIMEDTPNKLVIKDFLNVEDITLSDIIRRMDVMVRVMLDDVDTSFNKNMYDKLLQMDKSINKLSFLTFRVIRKGLEDPETLKSLKVESAAELLDYWLIAYNLETLADESKRVSRFLKNNNFSKEESEQFRKIFENVRQDYTKIMKSWYSRDINAAHELASCVSNRLADWDSIFKNSEKKIVGPLVERFKTIDGKMRNIARIIVDRGEKIEKTKD